MSLKKEDFSWSILCPLCTCALGGVASRLCLATALVTPIPPKGSCLPLSVMAAVSHMRA